VRRTAVIIGIDFTDGIHPSRVLCEVFRGSENELRAVAAHALRHGAPITTPPGAAPTSPPARTRFDALNTTRADHNAHIGRPTIRPRPACCVHHTPTVAATSPWGVRRRGVARRGSAGGQGMAQQTRALPVRYPADQSGSPTLGPATNS
jgi:hypothetical protein